MAEKRPLASHVQAAIVAGQRGVQAKPAHEVVRPLAPHVQAAMALRQGATQAKAATQGVVRLLAPHVQAAMALRQGAAHQPAAHAAKGRAILQRAEEVAESVPGFVFHATTKEGAASIKNTGLQPRDSGIRKGEAAVCVSPKSSGAHTLNQLASDVLLIISTDGIEGWQKVSENEWRTTSSIPVGNISWVPSVKRNLRPFRPLSEYSEEACRAWRNSK